LIQPCRSAAPFPGRRSLPTLDRFHPPRYEEIPTSCISLLLSQASYGQLSPADLNGFQTLLQSSEANPLRDCADSGLRKLYIYRAFQISRKSDADVEQVQLAEAQGESIRAQLKKEIELWVQTRLPNAIAQEKLDACLREVGLPTSESLSRLSRHCFGNALFSIDVLQAKDVRQPVEEVKARMRRAKLPISASQVNAFIDEMYSTTSKNQEFELARELFSSCIGANNGRY
jgi:hypothetical protein